MILGVAAPLAFTIHIVFPTRQKSQGDLYARIKSARCLTFCVRKRRLVFQAEFITECR